MFSGVLARRRKGECYNKVVMQDAYEKFEFSRIRETLKSKTKTERGGKKAESLMMYSDAKSLSREQNFVEETMDLLARHGAIPLDVSSDLTPFVQAAKKGGVLSPDDLEHIASDVLNAEGICAFFRGVNEETELLDYVSTFPHLTFLEKDIHHVIAPDLSIYDDASPKLKSIRASIRRLESQMKKKLGFVLESNKLYLSDVTMTLKNGHYVLPVKNAYKNKVKGIVQDISNTGETTFIEPELLVEMNNKMAELCNDEREEIHRLLLSLSQEVAGSGDALLESNEKIAQLDLWMAKARYAELIHGHIAVASSRPLIDLYGARHPLLDPQKVVANDFHLDEKTSLVVISGPNAGGKTVALKTLGLLVLMNQAGLPIPAEQGSSLSYFPHIFVDIGDSQSLSDNLSTFSGHMKNVGEILNLVKGKDLVLLDEVGTGTSPKEGEAIALAIVRALLRKHALSMISSHFEGLKAYALSHPEVTNASMMFDEANLLPTYRLKMGLPGESYGLVVAKRFGLPQEVLTDAKTFLEEGEDQSVSETIAKLSKVTKETEDLKANLIQEKAQLAKEKAKFDAAKAALALREEHFLSDVEAKKKRMLADYESQMDEILHSVEGGKVKLHEVIDAKKRLEELEPDHPKEEEYHEDLSVGDYVNLPSLYTSGRITKKEGNRIEVTSPEGIVFKTRSEKAIRVEEPKEKKKTVSSTLSLDDLAFHKSVPLELSLIGERAEEAKLHLEKYLDDCRIRHFKRVRIIHGWGSGVLRKVVRDYLDAHKEFVDHYEGADGNEGGGGATIVYLK